MVKRQAQGLRTVFSAPLEHAATNGAQHASANPMVFPRQQKSRQAPGQVVVTLRPRHSGDAGVGQHVPGRKFVVNALGPATGPGADGRTVADYGGRGVLNDSNSAGWLTRFFAHPLFPL